MLQIPFLQLYQMNDKCKIQNAAHACIWTLIQINTSLNTVGSLENKDHANAAADILSSHAFSAFYSVWFSD